MEKHINSSLKNLKLDGKSSIGYTFKALGSGFYGLRVGTDFRKTITEVIMEGGDADRYKAAICSLATGDSKIFHLVHWVPKVIIWK